MHTDSLIPPQTLSLGEEAVTLDEAFQRGSRHVQEGRLPEAQEHYRTILTAYPDHPRALHALGVVTFRLGDGEEGVELIRRAVTVKPDFPEAHNNLGNVLKELGRKEEAIAAYRCALDLRADFPDATQNLGQMLLELERPEEAVVYLRKMTELRPNSADAHGNLGLAYLRICLFNAAMESFNKVLELRPDHAPTHHNIGMVHLNTGRWDAAVTSFHRSLALAPDDSTVLTILGMTLTYLGRIDEALERLQQALAIDPGNATALNATGNALLSRGAVDEAIASYRSACTEHPDYLSAGANLLFALNYSGKISQRTIFEESVRHAALLPRPGSDLPGPPPVLPDPQRPLRIAYLSSDMRQHPVSYFLAPLLARHDRAAFEVACYASVETPDQVTLRLRGLADRWVDVTGMDQAAVARRIWEDRVDVVVELNGHTGGSLLPAVARRPAPVQVTWLGYPNTTGVEAVDYRLTDALADPPGEADLLHSEELYRLPHGFLCYEPPADAPPVVPAPLFSNGFVTFGSFNNLAKITPQVIELWARLLLRIPGSRLVLKNRPLTDPGTVEIFLAQFESHGVSRERITTLPYTNGIGSHLALYGTIDIALDPFPYNGTTTTCDALWMGVPVITLKGERHGARVGLSLLSRVGLEELAADSDEEYLARAVELAGDRDRLAALRRSLRERMAASDLCNPEQFARDVEKALRLFWENWCAGQGGGRVASAAAAGEAFAGTSFPIDPELAPSLSSLADRYRESGRTERAFQTYRQALLADPELYQALRGLAMLLALSGKREEAADHLALASRGKGCDAAAQNELGDFLTELGYPQQARECYLRAIALDPSLAVAHFSLANALALAGESDRAREGYQQALALDPALVLAYNNLGNLHCSEGRYHDAEACYLRALDLEPGLPLLHANIGGLWQKLGRLEEALVSLRTAVELEPGYAESWTNLGIVLAAQGEHDEALAAQRKALELKPDLALAHNNLGNLLVDMGEAARAEKSYRAALKVAPDSADFHANLGNALNLLGRCAEALESCRRALELKPDSPLALNNMGIALMELGRSEEGLESYRRSLRAKPDDPEVLCNMALALQRLNRYDEAEVTVRKALAQKEGQARPLFLLSDILSDQMKVDEGLEILRRALRIEPTLVAGRQKLAMMMNYSHLHSAEEIYRETRILEEYLPQPRHSDRRQELPHDPSRRIRIGYVSADLGRHPVGYFMTRVLAAHNKSQVEVFCYSSRIDDNRSILMKSCTDVWRNTLGMSDSTLEKTIIEDRIDILIDLSGHTAGNRLAVFARKPAPIQVTWLGYPNTTGLSSIDYRLTDQWADPEGEADRLHSERLVRLAEGFLCFDPPANVPPPSPPPVLQSGAVTFGSFNNPSKITPRVVELWSQLLKRMPHSRLLLKSPGFANSSTRNRFLDLFAGYGGDPERVEVVARVPSVEEHLAFYGRIDIALDSFPYNGTTTTCDSLWMGVPVVTLLGDRHAARVSASILSRIGLEELIARSPEEYLDIAEALGRDPERLAVLRAGLRDRMVASPLCDGVRFTASLEAAYRSMWRRWCGIEDE